MVLKYRHALYFQRCSSCGTVVSWQIKTRPQLVPKLRQAQKPSGILGSRSLEYCLISGMAKTSGV